MDPFVIGGLVQAGSGLIDSFVQSRQNRLARQWNEKMYAQQNADNLKFWHMQNEYNSPAAQMARLKSAGLNPNLMYGTGASAGIASQVKAGDTGSWKPAPLNVGSAVGSGIMMYTDLKQKQAQTDLLKTQQEIAKQELDLKSLLTIGQAIKNRSAGFDADQKFRMQAELDGLIKSKLEVMKGQYSIALGDFTARNNLMNQALSMNASKFNQETEIRKQHLADMRQQFNLRQDAMDLKKEYQRAGLELMTAQKLQYMALTANTKAQKDNIEASLIGIKRSNILKRFEVEMRSAGYGPNDNIFWRTYGNVLQRILAGEDEQKAFKEELRDVLH